MQFLTEMGGKFGHVDVNTGVTGWRGGGATSYTRLMKSEDWELILSQPGRRNERLSFCSILEEKTLKERGINAQFIQYFKSIGS